MRFFGRKEFEMLYKKGIHTFSKEFHGDKVFYKLLKENNISRGRIIDVGCGLGEEALFFAKKGFIVYGVDIAHRGLAKAKKHKNIHYSLCTAERLPFPNESFDFVFSVNFITFAPLRPVVNEMYRVLRKGGLAYIATQVYPPMVRAGEKKITVKEYKKRIVDEIQRRFHILKKKDQMTRDGNGKRPGVWVIAGKNIGFITKTPGNQQDILKGIVKDTIWPIFKKLGFKRKGNRFVKEEKNFIKEVWVVSSRWNTKDNVEFSVAMEAKDKRTGKIPYTERVKDLKTGKPAWYILNPRVDVKKLESDIERDIKGHLIPYIEKIR
ncbi:methyltransferase domain-containing protein [Candidatus Woesearchaeota archaeon]|nr:methyltransferase domain-containing protein [Candidatus Woesearchaeota archaeon]